ncbi:MAG TPA: hypothetical protein VFG14_18370 [Chthoniobacteraceae bacterium]|nr:hypothetical protein [Chthoniobacteraceae bacterium]
MPDVSVFGFPINLVNGRAELLYCVECLEGLPPSELAEFSGMTVCARCKPGVISKIRNGEPIGRAWRHGSELVVLRWKRPPNRCVICNESAGRFYKRCHFRWKTVVEIPLCENHRISQRRELGWTLFFVIVMASVPGALALGSSGNLGWAMALAPLLIPMAILAELYRSRRSAQVLRLMRASKDHLFLAGAGREFLASLPEWRRN